MVTFTDQENNLYQHLMDEGYVELAEFSRANSVRKHEVFEQLKNADVNSLYGSSVSAEMRQGMRRAIAGGDHDEVSALHSLLLSISERDNVAPVKTDTDRLGFIVVSGFTAVLLVAAYLMASLFLQ